MLVIFLLYVVPEIFVFIMASTAGGILSKAVIAEKITGKHFKNVLKEAIRLFVYAVILLLGINALKFILMISFL